MHSPSLLNPYITPSFGFFGAHELNCLDVSCENLIDEIVIELRGDEQIINLSRIELCDKSGLSIAYSQIEMRACASSVYESDNTDITSIILNHEVIHTKAQINPFIEMSFSPVYISRIRIYNRPDFFGVRSKNIIVRGSMNGITVFYYDNMAPSRQSEFAKRVYDFCSRRAISFSHYSIDLKKLSDVLWVTGGDIFKPNEILWLLNIWTYQESLAEGEFGLISWYLFQLRDQSDAVETLHLSSLSKNFDTKKRVKQLMKSYNTQIAKFINSQFEDRFIISKHFIHKSRLSEDKDSIIQHMHQLIALLAQIEVHAMICYGTLLGAERGAKFIEHDDDVDLLYDEGANSLSECISNRIIIIEHLKSHGYEAYLNPHGFNFNVSKNGQSIDLFPFWIENEKIMLMMEQYKVRGIDPTIVLPPSTSTLEGHTFPSPANPERFLQERYGDNWKIADPFHEWLWELAPSDSGG